MEARLYLEKVRKIDRIIENKMIELEQWRTIAEGTSAKVAGERVQTSKSQHKMEDAVIRIDEIKNEINQIVLSNMAYKEEVISTIEQLEPNYYDVLHKIYIQQMLIEQVATAYNTTIRSVNRRKGKALKQLQCILNEREKHEGNS